MKYIKQHKYKIFADRSTGYGKNAIVYGILPAMQTYKKSKIQEPISSVVATYRVGKKSHPL